MRVAVAVAACLGLACGSRSTENAPTEARGAGDGGAPDALVRVEIPELALGLPDVAGFDWRKRAGQIGFGEARAAEAAGDWPAVLAACRRALAADPGHLDAAWLLAVAAAKTNQLGDILAPLQRAAAGDFAKWGPASLALPSLQPWLATPTGQAWRARVEADRVAYVAAIARAIVVTARGDLFAYDLQTTRWHRLTRTGGAVHAALRVPGRLLYVTRQRAAAKGATQLALGQIDLVDGTVSRPTSLGTAGPILVGYGAGGAWIGTGMPRTRWRTLATGGVLAPPPPKAKPPAAPRLHVTTRDARRDALPVREVAADWDSSGLASAIRLGKSARVITVPSPALIDGHTVSWSPDRTHLAFVAQLDEQCPPPGVSAPSAAAYVADAATGALHELERASTGLAVEWAADRQLVVAGDRGVTLVDLDGGTPKPLPGADGLVSPRTQPRCIPAPSEELPVEEADGLSEEPALVQPLTPASRVNR